MRADDSALLLALYRSALDAPAWLGALAALAQRSGANTAHLVLQPDGHDAQVFGDAEVPLPAETLARMRYLRPYSGDDFAGFAPFRALRTRVEGGGDAWLILARKGADFAASTSVLLGGLAPHLALTAAQFWQRQRADIAAAAAQDIRARFGLNWVILGPQATPVLASEGAAPAAVLAGRLRLPAATQRLIAARVTAYTEGKSALPLALTFDSGQGLVLPFKGQGTAAILYIQSAKHAPKNAENLLSDLFGLTPTEARFAAEMAGGKSISEAGKALNFTLETARYYSKQIYAKLGAVGQADVIRRIENSVYRLI